MAHEDLIQAADRGLLGFDDRDKVRGRVLDAVRRAQAGNGGQTYRAEATACATGTVAAAPSAGTPPPSPSTQVEGEQIQGRLAATGSEDAPRLGLGAAAVAGAVGAAALRKRLSEERPEDVSPR